ncbi:amidase [Amycolatopsis rhizosphaerae]|uniref:Amidase n=1 Tax=Amycolatopsis rhizosphaerae TaxID=2053003 RepID=A0A558CB68_9PSEU|nr:amidase [Amycolatopsis rhizosphaerae]TVT45947.1 amidase [Amycolatopsis rhizosphaerae]
MSPETTRLRAPWSLRELAAELRQGTSSPAETLRRSRERIAATDSAVHAWVELDARPDPVASGPLGGVPLGVKDIIDVAGLPTRCGSGLREAAAPAPSDASIVTAWREAGAIPVGKTVTTEFAFFSPGPTGNPSAPGHTPGGSSSGSAAAVASGQVPLALGSQTAGSVIRPASYCGVAGMVMSHGRFPVDGVTGLSPSLDSHGLYAAGVTDLALAFSALTGEPDAAAAPARPARLLLWSATPLGVVEPAMRAALDAVLGRLVAAGAVVDEFPDERLIADVAVAHPVVMAYEAARERAVERDQADRLSAALANLLRTGASTPESAYQRARRSVGAAAETVSGLMRSYDAILGPAAPGPAPLGLASTGDPVLSRPWQALGVPQLSVPALSTADGLPLGVQLIGRDREETALLATGCWVERALAN